MQRGCCALNTPPCMVAIQADLAAGRHVGHAARFAVATFSLAAGSPQAEVVGLFRNESNFSPDKSAKIVAQMASVGYAPPNCDKMKRDGLCCNQVALCSSITNPISFLRGRTMPNGHVAQSTQSFEAVVIVGCRCGWRSKPCFDSQKEAVANGHYWNAPKSESDMHIDMEYLKA